MHISAAGLCNIDRALAAQILSLRPVPAPALDCEKGEGTLRDGLLVAMKAFNLLSAMNDRDTGVAGKLLATLRVNAFGIAFPELYLGLSSWGRGDAARARWHFQQHIARYSADVIAIHMVHMLDFLHGNPAGYRDYMATAAVTPDEQLQGYYDGMRAFAAIENGDAETCEAVAAAAVATNADDIYGLHALVHAYHTRDWHDAVVAVLEERMPSWKSNPGMNMHVFWHLAISYRAQGQTANAVATFLELIRMKADPLAETDIDTTDFLWRMRLLDTNRQQCQPLFEDIARSWAPSIYTSRSYFNDFHAAVAFIGAGERTFLAKLASKPDIACLDKATN
ncbi:MAG: hypothetical protein AAGD40_01155, partial [Pseudomonadota bacterium]